MEGESRAGPSNGDGDLRTPLPDPAPNEGVTDACCSGADNVSFSFSAVSSCLEAVVETLRLLLGRPNGLAGRSEIWLICDGRRTNGLGFSGDRDPDRFGVRVDAFVGEVGVGVIARAGPVEAVLFCRLNGDCRPPSGVKGRRD